jgi:hypothetical protein
MTAFRISLVVAAGDLVHLVADLNLKTGDGHIEREVRICEDRWLVTVAVTDREEAGLVRGRVSGGLGGTYLTPLVPNQHPEDHPESPPDLLL